MDYQKIRNKIKEARERCTLTQLQASEKIGISESQYQRIERGTNNPTLNSLVKISKAFGIPMDDFLSDEEHLQTPLTESIERIVEQMEEADGEFILKFIELYTQEKKKKIERD